MLEHPRARALFIFVIVGLAVIAMYFVFIASNESTDNTNSFGGAGVTSTLRAIPNSSATPMATAFAEMTPTPEP